MEAKLGTKTRHFRPKYDTCQLEVVWIELGRGTAKVLGKFARKMSRVLIAKSNSHFFNRTILSQQLKGLMLPLFCQPLFWGFACIFEEIALQRTNGNAAFLCQTSCLPVGLLG